MSSNSTDSYTSSDDYVCSKNERNYLDEINEINRNSNNEKYKLKKCYENEVESLKVGQIVDSGVENSERDNKENCENFRKARSKSVIEEIERYICNEEDYYKNLEIPRYQFESIESSVLDAAHRFMLSKTDNYEKEEDKENYEEEEEEDKENFDINEFTNFRNVEDFNKFDINDVCHFARKEYNQNQEVSLGELSRKLSMRSKKKSEVESKSNLKLECDSKNKNKRDTNVEVSESAKDKECAEELNSLDNSTIEIKRIGLPVHIIYLQNQLMSSNSNPNPNPFSKYNVESISENKPKFNSDSEAVFELKSKSKAESDVAPASIILNEVKENLVDDKNRFSYETNDSLNDSKDEVEEKDNFLSCEENDIADSSDTSELIIINKKPSNGNIEMIKKILKREITNSESISIKKRKLRNFEINLNDVNNENLTIYSYSGNSSKTKSGRYRLNSKNKNSEINVLASHLLKEASKQNEKVDELSKSQILKNIEIFNLDKAFQDVKKSNDKYLKSFLNFKLQYRKYIKTHQSLDISADDIVNECVESIATASIAYAHWIKEQTNDLKYLSHQIDDVDSFLKDSI